MTRKSRLISLALLLVLGCTSDPLGFRSNYRDRVVPPSANTQPYSNPPIAAQPGGQLGQPSTIGQSAVLPGAAISSMAAAQAVRPVPISGYPMLASANGQFDGRPFPYLTRQQARAPKPGGAKAPLVMKSAAARNTALASGVNTSPQEDLKYRGGRTIKDLKFVNIYVGGKAAWDPNDWKMIDKALAAAMADRRLNNVIVQYFGNQPVSATFVKSFFMDSWKPSTANKQDVQAQIQSLYNGHAFDGFDLPNTLFNFMLPRGSILGDPSGGAQQKVSNAAIPTADQEDSTGGLGGYHGSVHCGNDTVYFSIGAYSEKSNKFPNGTNGIPVFDQNWKNVVATFYHELQEARTDADVDDAQNGMQVLGWTSDSGNEIGDYPIAEARALAQVFQEIPLADGSGTVPVQFVYSNAVHGPEGPIDYPHGMEPAAGSQPPPNNPPPNNPPPANPPSNPAGPSSIPAPDLSNWNQLDTYIKQAILKLLS